MRITARIHGRGKVTIPVAVRDELELEYGDLVELDITPVGRDRDGE